MSKKIIFIILLSSVIGHPSGAQPRYLSFDLSVSQFQLHNSGGNIAGLSTSIRRCEGKYTGASYQFIWGQKNSISIGIGIQQIRYQKEWIGIFSESNAFGAAELNGRIRYWSFPLSYTWIASQKRTTWRRHYTARREPLCFGFSITYTPCIFAGSSRFMSTSGGADLAFLSSLQNDEQTFQHSVTLGCSSQFYLFNQSTRLEVEPYTGIGSSFFRESGNGLRNLTFGLRFRIGLHAKLPEITIEREYEKGNSQEKKNELLKKQKEIEEQLKNQNNPK